MAVEHIPPPSSRELLPPLLACLSTATASKQPPPALLPLLSPILRQRMQLLASDNWLPLLCWDSQVASKLPQVVGKIQVEPHPASGEIEVEDPDQTLYRRSDPETLHSRLILGEHGIAPTYLWCTGGDQGSCWQLAELRGIEHADDGTEWFSDLAEANKAGFRRKVLKTSGVAHSVPAPTSLQPEPAQQEEDDDDSAYWAAYDRTPGRTPQQKRSPAPPTNTRVQVGPTQSELEYFARYAQEVQPALDPHDPDEASGPGESTLNGNALNISSLNQHMNGHDTSSGATNGDSVLNGDRRDSPCDDKPEHIESIDEERYTALNHPRPSSSASSNSIERLEREAESHSQAELAIKQHISTDLKSLFRLARASGIEREEFERIIKRELEVLPLLEQDH
ncbi:hypothetical protein K458DRAFT_306994 [Lentithecium fluviatile CBS 122367]|uniref:Uncharacterized protein n=1 Tax=Lentithecium fluviatile CBS 122367 TaxID=1168545 RepID=A0A6G1IWS1_9PLEO|nr:hypothetical protein K458DRAFT_306994 [Lentithecium fluviatile CBS 122367]